MTSTDHHAPTLRHTRIRVDGIESPLVEAGPADAEEAVVCLHGNPGSSQDWLGLVARVGAFARVVAFDQPGFGRADKPAAFDHSYAGHAAHVGRVLDHLGVRRAHVVGHDLGGRWGMDWAASRPEAFASAVLVDGGVLLDYRWHYLAQIWRTRWVGEAFMAMGTRRSFRLLMRHGNRGGLPRAFVDRMFTDMDARTRSAILSLYRPDFDWNARSWALSDVLRPLDRPALVVWGARDPYIGVDQAYRQQRSFPRAQVVVLDDSGHFPFVDAALAFEDTAVDFLRAHVARS